MHEEIPDLTSYKRSPTFTEDTIPAGLKKDHSTKAGVYGRIQVEAGLLILTIGDLTRELREGEHAVTKPEQIHSVRAPSNVCFHIEFCRVSEP